MGRTIGDVYVLDGNLSLIYIIDTYKSCIWSNRYYDVGDCEVYLPAKPELMPILAKGNYLVRTNDDMVCRIKKVELDTDAENGDYLIVTGRDAKDLCDQRIIWSTMTCDGNLETFIRKIVTSSLINPSLTARKVLKPNGTPLLSLGTAAGFADVLSEQVSYKGVGDKIREYCRKYGWGYKTILSGSALEWILYEGTDRSDSVFFSDEYENLITTSYIDDDTNLGNVSLVGGEGEGSARSMSTSGYAESTDRYEIFVDAKDITHVVSWLELTTTYPLESAGGQGYIVTDSDKYYYKLRQLDIHIVDAEQLAKLQVQYPSGTVVTVDGIDYYRIANVTIADLPSQSPSDTDNVDLRDVIYSVYLLNRGYEKLADYGEKITFSGTVEPDVTFEYKKDYFLGDIVTVQNSYGITVPVRIVEIIEVNDDNGYSLQPKFEYMS